MAKLPVLTDHEQEPLRAELRDPVEYRKSGLSLNHVIGCPLDCAYCVRHLFDNFEMKKPTALMTDEAAVELLVNHRYFQAHTTPLQLFNRATDPFVPAVKPHTFRTLELLAARGLTNNVLVITRFAVSAEDAKVLNSFRPLRVTLLITYSGIDDPRIEPLGWKTAADSVRTAHANATSFGVVLYWRPIIVGLNDSPAHLDRALQLAGDAHATVFTGLFYRPELRAHYVAQGLPEPYAKTARRKIFPRELERRILATFSRPGAPPLFRKTSCAVAFAHKQADYNGHYGIREICDICPIDQVKRCAGEFASPDLVTVRRLATSVGTDQVPEIGERAIVFDALEEQKRYFIQHALGFQVHDRRNPHYHGRHGRAEIGWEEDDDD